MHVGTVIFVLSSLVCALAHTYLLTPPSRHILAVDPGYTAAAADQAMADHAGIGSYLCSLPNSQVCCARVPADMTALPTYERGTRCDERCNAALIGQNPDRALAQQSRRRIRPLQHRADPAV